MKLRVDSFISVSTSILHKYQHLFYMCTYFCPHPTFMMPARGYPRHDVNTRPNPVTWRSMCMWRKLTWTSKPTPTQLRHVHETHVHMNVDTLPNPVTWRSMCIWRKLTWMNVNTPQPSNVTKHVHETQVNMNVKTSSSQPGQNVCVFKNVHDYWRGFPPAGKNLKREMRGQKMNQHDTRLTPSLDMVVDLNSFIWKPPFFKKWIFTFAKLSRTQCLSFAAPMWGNNAYFEFLWSLNS